MQLYRGSGKILAKDISDGSLIPLLEQRFAERMLYPPGQSEVRSWRNSLPAVARELIAAELDDVEVLVEYCLPLSSKRVDVLVIGTHPKDGSISAVVWENKQWTSGDIENIEDLIVSVLGRRVLHPQQQIHQYVEYLSDFNHLAAEGTLHISGLAFLHNASSAEVSPLRSATLSGLADYPMFSGDQVGELRKFLVDHVSVTGSSEAADAFLNARIRPSKQLLNHVQDQIKGQGAFTLLDEQLVAYEIVCQAVDESRRSDQKAVVLVKGGPGTGKSVIATAVLGDLAKRGYNVSHATGSRSFTTTLKQRVGGRAGNLFRYFNNFSNAGTNELDVLVADEAHRIRETSNSRFTRREDRSGIPQVDELIRSARVPMFLLDQQQVVRPGEIGTVESILEASQRHKARVIEIDLNGQFRSGGSEGYLVWVQHFLGLAGDGPVPWVGDDRFELLLAETPSDVEIWLKRQNEVGFTARMAAGFCWPWSDPKDGELINDVVVGDWKRPWNLKPEKRVAGIPSASLWASDPAGMDQIGCIYTAQGFEYDYGGVVMGPDFTWRENGWHSDPSKSEDSVVKRSKNFDELVRHTYRVLLTRGLRGCIIHSTDRRTNDHLKSLGVKRLDI